MFESRLLLYLFLIPQLWQRERKIGPPGIGTRAAGVGAGCGEAERSVPEARAAPYTTWKMKNFR